MQSQQTLEKINLATLPLMMTSAREKTWEAVYAIKNLVAPGMTEKHAIKLANQYLAQQGVKKFWHKTHIRFGESTVLSFDDPYSTEDVILKEEDIFYIDIGPVWDGIEGDCGKTFVVGNNSEFNKISLDVEHIFKEISEIWSNNKLTGKELYSVTQNIVTKNGYLLEPSYVKGHRLSEFSHSQYCNLGIFDLDFKPATDRWVLELQICHSSKKFGAFFEDILTDQSPLTFITV